MESGLNNKQFVIVALIIMLSGIAIFSHDYFETKKGHAVENISVVFEENTGPQVVEPVVTTPQNGTLDTQNNSTLDSYNNTVLDAQSNNRNTNNNSANNSNNSNNSASSNSGTVSSNDPSGQVNKQTNKRYNYVGRIKIPTIGLNRGFVQAPNGKKGLKCVDQNVCSYSGSNNYPNKDNTHLILGAHNGSGWNAFFTRIDKLKMGNYAYIEYKGKRYKYKLVNSYKDGKGDLAINFKSNGENKQLSLFTCARPNYNRYYLVLSFKLVAEENM